MEKPAARLVTVVDNTEPDESKKVKHFCLCGAAAVIRGDGYRVCHPGTPWWKGLEDAEAGEVVQIELPSRTLQVTVQSIEPIQIPSIAA